MKKVLAICLAMLFAVGCSPATEGSTTSPESQPSESVQGSAAPSESADVSAAPSESADVSAAPSESADVSAAPSESAQTSAEPREVLTVGTSADYPPYEFTVPDESGQPKIVGFEMEIIRYLAEQMNMDIEIVPMDFNGLVGGIKVGTIDCAIAAMSVNEERKKEVDFSDFYFVGKQAALIRVADKDKYTTMESLTGVRAGVQTGTIHEKLAERYIPNVELVKYTKTPLIAMELSNKKIECAVLDAHVAESYAKKFSDLMVSDLPFISEDDDSYAIAVMKGNTELLGKLNAAIAELAKTDKVENWVVEATELMESLPR